MEKKPNLTEAAENKENSTTSENQTEKDYLIRMKAMRMAIAMKAAESKLKKK